MKNVIAKERIIFDNYDMESYFENAKQCLIDSGEEFDDDEIYDNAYDICDMDFQMALEDLERFFKDKEIICFGNVGLWHGVYDGGKIFNDFEEAFYTMTKDCGYFKIFDENGHLFIHCSHHDGSNNFEIKILNKNGIDYYERWLESWNDKRSEREVHNQIVKRYSVLPNFANKVYGLPKVENIKPTKEELQKKLFNKAKSFYS